MAARTGSTSSPSRFAGSSSPCLLLLLRFELAFASDEHPKVKLTPKSQCASDFDDARVLDYFYTMLIPALFKYCDLFRLSNDGFRV